MHVAKGMVRSDLNPEPTTKRPDIQGLRAVAVLLVVFFHAGFTGFGGGYVGVDVFLVISGFVISNRLIRDIHDRGRLGLAEFYSARARRLLPASLVVIVITVTLGMAVMSPFQIKIMLNDAAASALYFSNIVFAIRSADYLSDPTPSIFLHYWSLGLEEQFYLVWPFLLYATFKLFKRDSWQLGSLAAMCAASLVLCGWLTHRRQPYAFFLLPPRAWEFGLGAVVALLVHRNRAPNSGAASILGWAGFSAIAVSGVFFSTQTLFPGFLALVPAAGTAAVILAGSGNASARLLPNGLLAVRPLTTVGDWSYSLYLVHWPALVLPLAATGYMDLLGFRERVALVAVCFPIAWLLYRFIEQPLRHSEFLAFRPLRTLVASLIAIATTLALTQGLAASVHPRTDSGKPAANGPLAPFPMGTPYVPSNLEPGLENARADRGANVTSGCHDSSRTAVAPKVCRVGTNSAAPLIAIFGDSHAAYWYPALANLAEHGDLRLLSYTKSGCPPAKPSGMHGYPQCDTWRENVLAELNKAKPDLILLASFARENYGADDESDAQDWLSALKATAGKLPPMSRIAVFADTPSIGVTPTFCLGKFLDDARRCAFPRDRALSEDFRHAELEFTRSVNGEYLDFTDHFCNAENCPVIIGNKFVYRDDHHISATFGLELAPVVKTAITKALQTARPG